MSPPKHSGRVFVLLNVFVALSGLWRMRVIRSEFTLSPDFL